jgi:DNA-binding MarR family transcriptional regulator
MDNIINLLKAYQSFLDCGFEDNMDHFGQWLQQKSREQNHELQTVKLQVPTDQTGIDGLIGYQLGSIMSFTENWTKLAFRDLPLVGLPDFGILKFIEFNGNPSKKEIVQKMVMEASTCFEIIKRLQKNKMITEHTDPHDKRIRRVSLTDYGREIIEKATSQVLKLSRFLLGNLSNEEKGMMLPLLQRLNNFHQQWYHQGNRDKLIEMYQL